MRSEIVFISGFSGYDGYIRSTMQALQLQQRSGEIPCPDISYIDTPASAADLHRQIQDAWRAQTIPVVQTRVDQIKELAESLPDHMATRVLIAPDTSDTYYQSLLSRPELTGEEIDEILSQTERECDKAWLYDSILVDAHHFPDGPLIEIFNHSTPQRDHFDLLKFQEDITDLIHTRQQRKNTPSNP